jgi:hypothetical protein
MHAEMKYMRRTAGYTWTDYKTNTNSRQITGIQEELDTTCKQNASKHITQVNERLFPNW